MSLPKVVSKEEWLKERKALLAEEKALTRARDAVNTRRRELPMVAVDKDYFFEGPSGKRSLLDLFDGRQQLIVQHFMFDPSWENGCPSCSAAADEMSSGLIKNLNSRDTSFAVVSRAPIEKIERYKQSRGWTFPWVSSYGDDFNYDFNVTLDSQVAPVMWNYRSLGELKERGEGWLGEGSSEQPGFSSFLQDGGAIFHTYSVFARGTEGLGGSYYFLDITALGRQEEWEEPKDRVSKPRPNVPDFST
jgi:predicted dithiol-disulfide oxidoreductase (DUF899 family)